MFISPFCSVDRTMRDSSLSINCALANTFMESAAPSSTETTDRSGLLMPDDGFDPLAEIRRLRHELMFRLQQLQQSLNAAEKPQAVAESFASTDLKLEATDEVVSAESGTVLYVTPICEALETAPPAPSESTVAEPVAATPIEKHAETVPSTTDLPIDLTDSPFARLLAWINTVLVMIGALGVAAGLYYHVIRNQSTTPQQLAVMLFLTGSAMVLIGIIGYGLHRRSKLPLTGIAVPSSY